MCCRARLELESRVFPISSHLPSPTLNWYPENDRRLVSVFTAKFNFYRKKLTRVIMNGADFLYVCLDAWLFTRFSRPHSARKCQNIDPSSSYSLFLFKGAVGYTFVSFTEQHAFIYHAWSFTEKKRKKNFCNHHISPAQECAAKRCWNPVQQAVLKGKQHDGAKQPPWMFYPTVRKRQEYGSNSSVVQKPGTASAVFVTWRKAWRVKYSEV